METKSRNLLIPKIVIIVWILVIGSISVCAQDDSVDLENTKVAYAFLNGIWFSKEDSGNRFDFKFQFSKKSVIFYSGPDGVDIDNVTLVCKNDNACIVSGKNQIIYLKFLLKKEKFILLEPFSLVGYSFPKNSEFIKLK